MVALCINFVTIVSDGKQMLVSTALVALVVTTIELAEIRIELQQTALDNLVCIFHSLFQTAVSLCELWILLTVCYSFNLLCREWVVAPYEVCTCKKSLCRLL